jgi:hypothetical protein
MARRLTYEEENTGFMGLYNQINARGTSPARKYDDDVYAEDYSGNDDSFDDDYLDDDDTEEN